MMKILERRLGLPMAATYDHVRSVEQKVKDIFPDTEFVLVLGSDDTLHPRVFASAESRMGVIELVKEDFA